MEISKRSVVRCGENYSKSEEYRKNYDKIFKKGLTNKS